jgi:ABC-type amino acid transport substrate-binding protein
MRLKIIIPILLLVIGFFCCYVFLNNKKDDCSGDVFVVGTATGYAPWVSINEKNEYEGFDIDVITALAQKMNKKLELKDLGSMSALFIALDQGSIDAIIWGLSITKDRLKKVEMIHYQGKMINAYPLIFWKQIPPNITTIDDMQDKTVCVEPASAQDAVLSKYAFINKKFTEKIDDALLNIQYGKADAAFVEPAIANKFKSKYPEIISLDIPLAPDDQVRGVGIAIKRGNTTIINAVKNAVDELKRSSVITMYEKKWSIS